MKIALLALTDRGLATALRIGEGLPGSAIQTVCIHEKALPAGGGQSQEFGKLQSFRRLSELVPALWRTHSVLIFVMATGIVLRQIASLIDKKDRDPAVLVLDEAGKFVIPLLSGHLGGANAWARQIAQQIKAQAVITTATDGRGLVAPDEYARRYGWKVEPVDHLPAVNRLLLEQGFLNVFTPYPLNPEQALVTDSHYRFLTAQEKDKAQVMLDAFPSEHIREDCLYLVPPVLSVGVGCRRGISCTVILEMISSAFKQIGASPQALSGIYSVDLKAEEAGLVEAAEHLGVPFKTFSAEELQTVNEQEHLQRSDFVNKTIGVDGVCEAASLLGANRGRLILPKIKGQGVTVAISLENFLSSVLDRETPLI
ncbi:cobalt-precorrin 5A hydrolase [Desulfosporosinus sp. PR]|uniref:cobalt-precorrin 5A hydrolase n=1 Tax=Candidatus Desulfosporosinus nitrosoreducens TaxID=3401928 RepID=UPI0027EDBDE8|nr:cobalt-precorrin 5A hydrolase [Desulfosporosinus sp. PR]MDQ7093454.1 cobalt-precorrin 5A hydrolase [Desulfosporosinus sp. PR]